MARATLKTIAEQTGFSITTVSRALKDGPEVKPDTIQQVKEVATELGYRPNTSGIGLKTGQTFVLALIIPFIRPGDVIGDVGTLSLIEGLTAGISDTDYHLTVIPRNPEEDDLAPVRHVVEKGLADGVILTSTLVNDKRIPYLHEKKVPFVTFGRTELATPHPWYDIDNADFVYQAARHLYQRGRKNLLLLTPSPEFMYGWHRITGFRRAAHEFGIQIDDQRSVLIESDSDDHRVFVEQACAWDNPPDGYICGTEVAALVISSTLQNQGMRPGVDVDVVTMETSRLAEFYHPPMTAFKEDLHYAGRLLSSLLLRALAGEPASDLQVLDRLTITERG
ncbi:MAG: LacI family transcriptional regulator [Reinekea sp.]|jgi:LacI family transcriptional regulator